MMRRKIVTPCKCDTGKVNLSTAFCKIEFKNGNLSISGVIGPYSNGNAAGSCGQCIDEIRNGTPDFGWNEKMLNRFCDIWEEWHLNDLRPYCKHQKELGWDELAKEKVMLYNYTLSREGMDKKKSAEKVALDALRNHTVFTPTDEQTKYANLQYSITTHEELTGEMEKLYEPKKPIYMGDKGATEVEILGWLKPDQHPDGILCKPCPVCGYKYGASWFKEEVPSNVIEWLFNLPDAIREPAWI